MYVVLSPKSQVQPVIILPLPFDVLVKVTVNGGQPLFGVAVKLDVGGPQTVITTLDVAEAAHCDLGVTVRVNVTVPAVISPVVGV